MMAKAALDNNEHDPNAEYWTAHWSPSLELAKHGADLLGACYNGSYQVMKRLKQRKLVDVEGRMSHDTGVALNDRGREAIAA